MIGRDGKADRNREDRPIAGRDADGFAVGRPCSIPLDQWRPGCVSRAGRYRREHELDKDGVCLFCDEEVLR